VKTCCDHAPVTASRCPARWTAEGRSAAQRAINGSIASSSG
jgi:hypothetical protein